MRLFYVWATSLSSINMPAFTMVSMGQGNKFEGGDMDDGQLAADLARLF